MGFHSLSHISPANQGYEKQKVDFEKGMEIFEKIFNPPYGYRCASGGP